MNKELILKNLDILKEASKRDRFRFLAYSNAINILNRYKPINIDITNEDLPNIKKLKGIGKRIYEKIIEILKTKKLKAISKIPKKSEKEQIVDLFSTILGVGDKTAINWYDKGYRTIEDLSDIKLNRTQKIGLQYIDDLLLKIPRKEIECGYQPYIKYGLDSLNNSKKSKNKYEFKFIIAGSYRRKKSFSNDIDVLITELTENYDNEDLMNLIIEHFKEIGLIIEELTKGKSKFTGLSQISLIDNKLPVRRFDIELVRPKDWYYALLYFTGSKSTNQQMRLIAKKQGYLLNQYGLFDLSNKEKRFNVKNEKEIFNKIGIKYLKPEDR